MIRKLLLMIRKTSAKLDKKKTIIAIAGTIALWIVGVILDIFMPFGFWFNMIRAFICVSTALVSFSALYLYAIYREQQKQINNISYKPIRSRFTYKERVNLSILMWAVLFIILLFTATPMPAYTFLNSWVIVGILAILTFTRATKAEFIRGHYGLDDVRDFENEQAIEDKIKKRHAEWARQENGEKIDRKEKRKAKKEAKRKKKEQDTEEE